MRLFISEDFPPRDGGLSTWAYHLSTCLHDRYGKVLVMARNYFPEKRTMDRRLSVPIWRMLGHDWRRFGHLYIAYYLLKFLLTHGTKPIIYATRWKEGLVPALLQPVAGWKIIVAAHGNDVIKRMTAWRRMLFRMTFRRAHVGVAVSRYTAEVLVRLGIPPQKVVFIPNGVDAELFYPQRKSATLMHRYGLQGKKVLLSLARLVPRKGQDQVIRALPQIVRSVPEVVYLVGGRGGHKKELRTLAQSVGVQDRVIFAGFIPQQELVAHYNLADVYIMPSREIPAAGSVEGFGITFLEANACGIPVIGGRSGGIPDAIVDGQTGLLVDPGSPDEIAAAAVRLLNDQDFAEQLGHNGRQRVLQTLQWRHIAERFVAAEGMRT
jgi:phosphatidylinositol alpha-1,6-mannosyltransferase